jgi:uncharacterized protein YmfQ (DUF2313 family)
MNNQLLPRAPADRHIRRSGDDYGHAFLQLLPRGQVWSRQARAVMVKVCRALAYYWGFVDGRAADLLERECDPQRTLELLPEWEHAYGLPDPCFPEATTLGERQKMLVTKITWMGGQSRAYFIDLMDWLGGFHIVIHEWAPFMAGVSRCGDTRFKSDERFRWYIGPPEGRFVWTAHVGNMGLVWFRAQTGEAGVDHHLEIRSPLAIECLLRRWKPAHTHLVLDYSDLELPLSPFAGTP